MPRRRTERPALALPDHVHCTTRARFLAVNKDRLGDQLDLEEWANPQSRARRLRAVPPQAAACPEPAAPSPPVRTPIRTTPVLRARRGPWRDVVALRARNDD